MRAGREDGRRDDRPQTDGPAQRPNGAGQRSRRARRPSLQARGLGDAGCDAAARPRGPPGEVRRPGGLLGSGRTETARLLFGLDRADAGQLERRRRSRPRCAPRASAIAPASPSAPRTARPRASSPSSSVRENIVLALQARAASAALSRGPPGRARGQLHRGAGHQAARPGDAHLAALAAATSRRCCWPAGWSPSRAADPRRADPRHRRGGQGRDPGPGHAALRRRHGGAVHLLRAGGGRCALATGSAVLRDRRKVASSPPARPTSATV